MLRLILVSALLLLGVNGLADQSTKPDGDEHAMPVYSDLSAIKWGPGSPAFSPGMKMFVMSGDPDATGFVSIRVKMPAGYVIPPHSHPFDEHVTVLSGKLFFGRGNTIDKKTAKSVKEGGYFVAKAQMPHYAYTKSGAVVQIDIIGPFGINYINPSDDPRNKASSK